MSIGVVIGRFQTPELTVGHLGLLNTAASNHRDLLIIVGEMPSLPNSRNPLPFYIRKAMLAEHYPEATIIPVQDARSDEVWSRRIDNAIASAYPLRNDVVLYGGRDCFIPHYSGKHRTEHITDATWDGWSATCEREALRDDWRDGDDFRAGMIHAVMRLPGRVYPTVDIAVVRGDALLVAQKPGESLVRFPGGFVDPTDASLEAAARRELAEETGLVAESIRYIGSFMIDDWRNRGVKDCKVCTTLFLAVAERGEAAAMDDIASVQWQSLASLTEAAFVEEHRPLFTRVVNALYN